MKNSWLRKSLVVGTIIVFVGASVVSAFNRNSSLDSKPLNRGNTLFVGGSGPGNYSKIQDAIDSASDGDTVFVYAGLYIGLIIINHTINLIGEDKNTTIIDGNDTFLKSTVTIKNDNVSVSNFTIQNGSPYGIDIFTSNNTISDNIITRNDLGIELYGDFRIIKDNLISDNQIINNSNEGIETNYWVTKTIVSHNIIRNSLSGIEIYSSGNNIISNNILENATNIELVFNTNNTVENNVLISSGYIELFSSKWIVIKNNTFIDSQGIKIFGENIDNWDTHTIENNTMNGKLIYYYKQVSNVAVPSNAAEVILVGCTNCVINHIVFSEGGGIQLGYSSSNIICGNTINGTIGYGIHLQASSKNNLSYNSITNSDFGIYLDPDSSNNWMYRNIIKNNKVVGIECTGTSNNWVENHIADNPSGMWLVYASDTTIRKNNFVNNRIHILFVLVYQNEYGNKWESNFYSPQINRLFKIIFGGVQTRFYYYVGPMHSQQKVWIYRPGFNIDWHPAQKPYYIPGMR
jgi:parallel beta-helix repeat protein